MIKKPHRNRIFRGFSSQNNNKKILYDTDIIRQDLINHLNTRVGERVMMPTFGCIIWDKLFEPMSQTLVDEISENIVEIVESDSRLEIDGLLVDNYEHGIVIECDLLYRSLDQVERFQMAFDRRALENTD